MRVFTSNFTYYSVLNFNQMLTTKNEAEIYVGCKYPYFAAEFSLPLRARKI